MLQKFYFTLFLTSIFLLVAWSRLPLVSAATATPTPPVTPTLIATPSPILTNTRRAGVWTRHAAENPAVHALVVEGNFVWTATNGDGVIRWNRVDGTFTRYNTATGLVHNIVRAIATDGAGRKWFGTEGGVSEFDGHTWTSYTTAHGLADNKVLAIAIAPTGHKWFATWGGVSQFDGHTWVKYTRANGLPSNHIQALAVDRAGRVWIGTPNGVAQFDGRRWTIFTTADGLAHNSVHAIVVDWTGRIWFVTPGGVSRFDGHDWTTYTTAAGLPTNHIQALTLDESGRIWAATALGLSIFDDNSWLPYDSPPNHILALAIDETGQPWLGTADGIVGFDGHAWSAFHTGGLVSNEVKAMAEDRAGRKWFATYNGVSVYDGRTWTTYTSADGLADNRVNDLAVDAAGRLWFATEKGISTFDGRRWANYTSADGLPENEAKAIGRDEAGRLWFKFWLSDSTPASRLDDQTWTTITDTQTLPIIWDEFSVAVDKTGRRWTALGEHGVQIFDGHETSTQGIENLPFVFTVAFDRVGKQWFGGSGGVTVYDGSTRTTYTAADGLSRGLIWQMLVDWADHKWFNMAGAGIMEFDETAVPIIAQTPPEATPAAPSLPRPATTLPISGTGEVAYPALINQISLAAPEKYLRRLLFDQAGHLYVLDNAGRFYILDTDTLGKLAVLDIAEEWSEMTLDAPNHRLYVFPARDDSVFVLDTESLAVVGTVSPSGRVNVDSGRNQFYVNSSDYRNNAILYDGASLAKLNELSRRWITYNPVRDELLSAGISLVAIDRETQRPVRDILPDFTAQDCYDCGGSAQPGSVEIFPEQNLIAIGSIINSPGHGGISLSARFFNATTLDELTDLTGIPAIERGCGEQPLPGHPINGRIYRGESFSSVSYNYNTLLVYGPDGELETGWDGKDLGITNPNTAQMYLPDDGRVWVMDLATLSPIGMFSADCILNLDLAHGRIYARRGGELRVFSEWGGQPEAPPPPNPAGLLPEEPITSIKVSPDYPADSMILIQVNGRVYRSTDAGLSWARLRGGLPETAWLDVEISPNFAQDRTLFAGGTYYYGSGTGMYRSTDAGETWQPFWSGLTHFQIKDVVLSPNYAQDGTLLAYAKVNRFIPAGGEGGSVFRSTNRGLSWTLVISAPGLSPELLVSEKLLPPDPAPTVRFRAIKDGVERSNDDGQTWQPLLISRRPEFSASPRVIVPSPDFEADRTVYVLSNEALYRSTDGGKTWMHGFDQFVAGRTYPHTLQTMAISPPLKDGNHRLFLGSMAGEFLDLNPAEIKWQAVLQ